MTEDEARAWTTARFGPPAVDRLARLSAIVVAENMRQNLIAPSTVGTIWSRHIVDSLQLLAFACPGTWIDIGSGAGFPGLAVAAVEPDRPMRLVEPRRLRADFLRNATSELELQNVAIESVKIENAVATAAVISARAVAKIAAIFGAAAQCARNETIWLLPKGRGAQEEVAEARRTWHGVFHVEQSITNPESAIVIARHVRHRR